MANSHLKPVAPTEVNRTVAPTRRPNAGSGHLTSGEVIEAPNVETGNGGARGRRRLP
jgi:hypothetical protein